MENLEDRVVLVRLEVLERKEQGVNSAHKEHLVTPDQWDPLASQGPRALWVQREKQVPPVFRDYLVREEPREAADHPANEENLVYLESLENGACPVLQGQQDQLA